MQKVPVQWPNSILDKMGSLCLEGLTKGIKCVANQSVPCEIKEQPKVPYSSVNLKCVKTDISH